MCSYTFPAAPQWPKGSSSFAFCASYWLNTVICVKWLHCKPGARMHCDTEACEEEVMNRDWDRDDKQMLNSDKESYMINQPITTTIIIQLNDRRESVSLTSVHNDSIKKCFRPFRGLSSELIILSAYSARCSEFSILITHTAACTSRPVHKSAAAAVPTHNECLPCPSPE